MEIVKSVEDMRKVLSLHVKKKIGLVPTMGFIHEGHLSLVRLSNKENELTVVSIYINPIQFDRKEDLESYPQDWERDIRLLNESDVDILFLPNNEEIYSKDESTRVDVTRLNNILEGKYRPGHFIGVGTVVLKLLNTTKANKAYFGEKDFQQVKVIQRLTKDLFLDTEIIPCPILREEDGLAMSSRNINLSEAARKEANVLYRSLLEAKKIVSKGEYVSSNITTLMVKFITQNSSLAKIDFISINSQENLEELKTIGESGGVISMAVFFGDVRLIDNLKIDFF